MARVCQVTGKVPLTGNSVSHSNIKTKRRFLPNLQKKKFYLAEEDKWITLKVSTEGIRTINKRGLYKIIKEMRANGQHIQKRLTSLQVNKFTSNFLVNLSTYQLIIFSTYQLNKMAKKGNRVQVIMECTEHKNSGKPGTSRYITTKNKKNNPERLELKKFNPILKKVTVHKEIK